MTREMKDSGIEWIGQIPKSWEVVKVKNIFKNTKKIVGDREKEFERLALTLKGVLKRDKNDNKGLQSEKFSTYQILEKDELVFKMIDLENKNTSRVGFSKYTGIVSPVYIILNNDKYTRYGYYFFYDMWQRYIFNTLGNNGVRSALNTKDMLNLPFLKLDLREQEKIANYLDKKIADIDLIIEKTKATIEDYKKYKQSIITKAVTKGLNPNVKMKDSGLEEVSKIPIHWDIKKIKYVLKESNERTRTGKEEPLSMSQKYGLIPTKNMDRVPNMASSFDNCKIVHKNDLVFNKLKAHLGVFSKSNYNGIVSPDYAVYSSKAEVEIRYLEFLFKTKEYISQFIKFSRGVAQGLTRLYTEEFFNIYIVFPCLEEQQQIVEYLDKKIAEIDNLIAKKESLISEMEEYKKSLIYECVTGKKEII